MGYKLKLKHNVSGKTLRVNLKYEGLPEIPVDVTGEYKVFSLSPWDGVSGGLDVRKIKIEGIPVSDDNDNNVYNIRYYKITDSEGNSSTGGNENPGGGGSSSGGGSANIPNHNGENTAGGEVNHYIGDITYNSGEGDNQISSTVPESSSSTVPEPDPEPVLPTDIVSQTFNLPVSSSSPNISEPIRLYSNGGYRVMSQNASDIPSIDGTMIKGLTSNVTGIKLNDADYTFDNSEFVQTLDGNYDNLVYTTIPAETFSYANEYKIYVNYEGGTTSTNNVTVSLPFMYDLAKGNLRIYENGKYRYFSDDEDDTPKSIVGTLIPELADYQNVHLYEQALSFDRNFSNSETVVDGNETVTLNYATISTAESLRPKGGVTLSVKDSNNKTLKTIKIYTYDSTVNIQFKMDSISIDRSNYYTLLGTSAQPNAKQLPYDRLEYYLTATDRDGNSVNLNKNVLGFYIGEYRFGSTGYNGNVVSIYDDGNKNVNGWMFRESCTWEKDAYDIIHVVYGDNLDAAQLRVELVDSDPDNILLRGFKPVDDFASKTFLEGESHFIGEFIHHYPEDALFSTTPTYRNYSLEPDMISSKGMITNIHEGIEPKNWEEFYNDQVLTMLNAGTFRLHYGWYGNGNANYNLSSFGGEMTVTITPNKYVYDMEDGDLKIYPTGYCISGSINTMTQLFRVIEGRSFHLSLNDVDYYFDGDNPITIDQYPVPGEYKLYIVYDNYITNFVKLEINDRKFTPTFKVSEIKIDRSDGHNFTWQLEHNNGNLGTYITDSNLITYTLNYINIPDDCKVNKDSKYLYSKIHMKLNDMYEKGPYGYCYYGNAVEVVRLGSSNNQWCFRDSSWKKDKTDTLYMMFGDRVYEPGLTIKTYDSNPSMVCLRGITDSGYNHTFNVNQVYTLRDLFGFYPGDASNFSLKMSVFDLTGYDTSAIKFTKLMDSPKSWSEFYDSYIQVTVLKKGLFDCYVSWESMEGIGGQYLIKLRGVTDGTGKKQSSSGSQTTPTPTPDEGTSGGQSSDKPKKGPDLLVNHTTGSNSFKYLPSMGDIRIYDDSSYRFISNDSSNDGIPIADGALVGKYSYQEPEVRDLPVDVTVTKVKLYNDDLLLTESESLYDKTNDEITIHKYVDVPISTVFRICGEHSFQLHFTDNYSGASSRPNIGFRTMFEYDFADGHLRIYDNGCYRLVPYSEVNGGQPSITPVQQGRFFRSIIDLSTFERCYFDSKGITFDNSENVYEFYKDNIPGDRYTIDFYSVYSNQTSIDTTAFQNMYVSNIIKSGTEYVTVKPLTIESGTVTNGGGRNKECIELGSNSKLIVNLSYDGQIRADKIIVKCKKSGDDGNLTVNGIGPYEPVNSSSSPSDLVFEVSHLEAIQKIVLEATQNILVDSITVVKHNFDDDVIQPVNHGYFDITPSMFRGSLWPKNIDIKSNTSAYSYGSITISPSDSRINISFTTDEITLDRSNKYPINTQLKPQGGETMFDFLKIEVGDGVDYIESDTGDILDAIKDRISFYIDRYSPGATQYAGSSISIDGTGEISHCNWKKDAVDVIKVKYAGRTYDTEMTIRIIQTTDDVYIRRMNCNIFKPLYLGNTYTLRDFVSFVPEDVVDDDKYFKHMEIVHHAPSWSVLNNTMDFQFITNSNYVTRTPSPLAPENAPNNWQEFWNWITVTPVKTGEFTLYYMFRTDIGGGGGEVTVRIK